MKNLNIRKYKDEGYVINLNGRDYLITPKTSKELYDYNAILDYIAGGGECLDFVDEIPEIPIEQQISALGQQSLKYTSYILAGIDVDLNQQKLVDIMLEIEELKGNLE